MATSMDKLLELLVSQQSQQQQILDLQRQMFESLKAGDSQPNQTPQKGLEFTMESLANHMSEFCYDPARGVTFQSWYSRYEDLFREDGSSLDDKAKVRLLMRKLNPVAHEQYVSYILPKHSRDLSFKDTIETLNKIFGAQESVFNVRYRCLKTAKDSIEDFVSFAAKVNKRCEDFKLGKLTIDQFKCLMFVCGLQSDADADIRTRLLSKLESETETEPITLDKLVSETQRIINLKKDTALIGNTSSGKHIQPAEVTVNKIQKHYSVQYNKKIGQSGDQQYQQKQQASSPTPRTPCWACGKMHFFRDCSYATHKCSQCKKVGHKEGYCACFINKPISSKTQSQKKNKMSQIKSSSVYVNINQVDFAQRRRFVTIKISNVEGGTHIVNVPLRLQIDTASDVTIVSKSVWESLGKPGVVLDNSSIRARSASQHGIRLIAYFKCDTELTGEVKPGRIFVTDVNENLNILGIDLCDAFNLWAKPLSAICSCVTTSTDRQSLISGLHTDFAELFSDIPGICTKANVRLHLKADAKPVFRPKRPVAYAALGLIERELNRLQDLGIISPVEFSDWAAPIVVAKKSNGKIRICGDYSTGLNDALQPHQYPLPVPADIFATLSHSEYFSHIDLSDAYLQVEVDDEAKKLLTINTHKGLFSFNRLAPGVKSAPGAFQQVMDTMLAGIENVATYLDDVLICGPDLESHISTLKQVLQRLMDYGFRIKLDKCTFLATSLKYLGHIIDRNGLRPDPANIEKIKNLPKPTNITQLRSFLGSVNHYGKFVKEMRRLRAPLDNLLRNNTKFEWTAQCQQSFEEFKALLSSDLVLTHFDPELPIKVAADASNDGIGAYIAHTFPDGSEKVIMHAARTLTAVERKYSQIEKEGLALIFAVTKFHRFIYGRSFKLLTDHKPLLSIFGSKKGIPVYTANRLQRWALTLMLYDFEIEYVNTNDFGCVDMLSRLIGTHAKPDEEYVIACAQLESDINMEFEETVDTLPLTAKMIQRATCQDKICRKVAHHIKNGWPVGLNKNGPENRDIFPFFHRREALSLVNNCIMFGNRVVIPKCFKQRVLRQLHRGHPGVERMKALARSFVYWTKIDDDITQFVKQCHKCASAAKMPVKTTLQSWPISTEPMQRLHMDIAGPLNGKFYLVIVDAFSKWPEIFATEHITSMDVIEILLSVFARFGDCKQLVTDNGTQFISNQFKKFVASHGIKHWTTAPYHPQSNGQAERFVDTFKRSLKKLKSEGTDVENLNTFLQMYRATPNRNAPRGLSPAELFIKKRIRTSLDLMLPGELAESPGQVNEKQNAQFNRRHGAKHRFYAPGDLVFARTYSGNTPRWRCGEIIEKTGNVNYNVLIDCDGRKKLIRSHANQIRNRVSSDMQTQNSRLSTEILLDCFDIPTKVRSIAQLDRVQPEHLGEISQTPVPIDSTSSSESHEELQHSQEFSQTAVPIDSTSSSEGHEELQPYRTHSRRTVRRPAYLDDYVI